MIPFLICFILSFTETAVYVSALEVLVDTKDWYKRYKWLIVTIATMSFVLWAYVLDEVFYIKITASVISYIVIAKLIVKAKTSVVCSLAMMFHNYLVMLEYSIMLLIVKIAIFRNINPALEYDYYELIMIAIEVSINIAVILICYKYRGRLIELMSLLRDKEWLSILLITFFSSLILTISVRESGMQENYYVDLLVICVDVTIVFLDFAIVGLFTQSIKKQKNIVESEEILTRVKNEISLYRSISDNLEKQKRKSHEYGNQMAAIKGMLELGELEQLQEYVSTIVEKDKKLIAEINTNHVIINAILNVKYEEAMNKGISYIVKVSDLSQITISDEDIVILLSNLLNNAIEACEQAKEKYIKIKFAIEDNQIILSVHNSMEVIPDIQDGEFITSKKEQAENHGIGLKNVKEVVEKYKGKYVIDYDETSFKISMIIPM